MTTLHELRIDRLIDAPVDAVWRAWAEHVPEWFCPRPWQAEVVELDLRAGGRNAFIFRGPEGEAMPQEGVYLEVVPGVRVVATDAFTAGWCPNEPFMLRIDTFAAEGDRTRYAATARHWTAEARAQHLAMGFESGWGAAADQLAEVARRLAG